MLDPAILRLRDLPANEICGTQRGTCPPIAGEQANRRLGNDRHDGVLQIDHELLTIGAVSGSMDAKTTNLTLHAVAERNEAPTERRVSEAE